MNYNEQNDPFGVEREKIIKKAGVRDVFTPTKPVDSIDLFFGRTEIVKSIIESINTEGQHILLYGERGVGKSSLSNITVKILQKSNLINNNLIIKKCSSLDTFETIIEEIF